MSYSVFPEILFLLVLSSLFVWLTVKFKSKGAQKVLRAVWICGLAAYAVILIWAALISREKGYSRSLNLDLFSSYRFMLRQYNSFDVLKQVLDNVFVFVPLGILLPAAYNAKHEMKNYVFVVFCGLICSLIIEALQYTFSIGFTEIDDIVDNTWGAMMGCGIYALTGKAEAKKDSVVLKKGWFKCLLPIILYVLFFGAIWCYREFYLCTAQ